MVWLDGKELDKGRRGQGTPGREGARGVQGGDNGPEGRTEQDGLRVLGGLEVMVAKELVE